MRSSSLCGMGQGRWGGVERRYWDRARWGSLASWEEWAGTAAFMRLAHLCRGDQVRQTPTAL